MKRFFRSAALAAAMLLCACAASRQAYYDANAKSAEATALAAKAKFDALAAAAGDCDTEGCRGMAMMGIAMTDTPQAQAIRQYRSEGWQLLGLANTVIRTGANAYSEDSRNELFGGIFESFASNAGDRSVRIDNSNNSTNIADSYNDSSDNSEHGDTISDSGNTTIADSYNTPIDIDVSGDGSAVGDGNDIDNSTDIDQSDDGDDCSGESCNPVEQPAGETP